MAIFFNLMYPKICLYALSPAPPLTVGNILKAMEGVENWRVVADWLGTALFSSSLKEAVEEFLQGLGDFQPSWRSVIFVLDGVGETPIASRIRSYGEPVQGRYTYTHRHKNTYTHTIPRHVYHHSSVGCSTIHIPYMWTGEHFRQFHHLLSKMKFLSHYR